MTLGDRYSSYFQLKIVFKKGDFLEPIATSFIKLSFQILLRFKFFLIDLFNEL